jgi:hypothetical protein
MREPHAFPARHLNQQMGLEPSFRRPEHSIFLALRDACPDVERHLMPDHRRDGEQPLRLIVEPSEPPVDHLPQERRDGDPREVTELPYTGRVLQCPLLYERAQQLTHEQRVPLRPGVQVVSEPLGLDIWQWVARGDESADRRTVDGVEVESLRPGLAHERGEQLIEGMATGQLVAAIRGDQ